MGVARVFDPFHLWRHPEMQTVAFAVHKRFYVEEKKLWKLKVEWVNISPLRPPMYLGYTQHIDIPMDVAKRYIRMELGERGPPFKHKEF